MFSLTNGTRQNIPPVPFSRYAKKILGSSYELSVALVGDMRMRRLNRTYRHKDAVTDILAFPLGKHAGEIILNVKTARAKSSEFGLSPNEYLKYVFIHGCVHLKGYEHGRTMERLERTWCRALGVVHPTHALYSDTALTQNHYSYGKQNRRGH